MNEVTTKFFHDVGIFMFVVAFFVTAGMALSNPDSFMRSVKGEPQLPSPCSTLPAIKG